MRIALDARMIGEKAHGIGQYALLLLKHLGKLYPHDEFFALSNSPAAARKLRDCSNVHVEQVSYTPFSAAEQYGIPLTLRRIKPHIFHATSVAVPAVKTVTTVITIHDMIPFIMEPSRLIRNTLYKELILKRAARSADAVITDSLFTRKDVIRLLRPEEQKVHVIYIGVEDHYYEDPGSSAPVRDRYGLSGDYFFTMISRRPHKNPEVLVDAFQRFIAKGGRDVTLAIGGLMPESLRMSVEGWGCPDRIRLLGYVPEEDLPLLYHGALAFVFPSLYEGFGLPVLEAMASGTMVLSSHAASLPEVLGEAGFYFDPHDSGALADLMARAFDDRKLREAEGARGREEARKFTWDRCAQHTYGIYRSLVQGGGG